MNNDVLIKMYPTGSGCIALVTIDRAHGRRGRFLLIEDDFIKWMSGDKASSFMTSDCGHVLEVLWDNNRDEYFFKVLWLSMYGNDDVRGFRQMFSIPKHYMWDCVRGHRAYLYHGRSERVQMEVMPGAAYIIRRVCENKIWKRALSKALRDNFHYGYGVLVLFGDGWFDFGFYHDGMCGGLVIHTVNVRGKDGNTYPKTYFSVHT